jgi:hypothetical protein
MEVFGRSILAAGKAVNQDGKDGKEAKVKALGLFPVLPVVSLHAGPETV